MQWTPTEGNHGYAVNGATVITPGSGIKAGVTATPHKIAGTPGTGKTRPGAGEV